MGLYIAALPCFTALHAFLLVEASNAFDVSSVVMAHIICGFCWLCGFGVIPATNCLC